MGGSNHLIGCTSMIPDANRFIHKELKKMRIVAGTYRSRVIEAVDGDATRPTLDKVKEAVFSRIGPYFNGGEMLDLFGGSGNVSLEAISRGMSHAILCDVNGKAIATMRKNIQTLGVKENCEVWKLDYKKALALAREQGRKFDFVYLDPPYRKQQIDWILTSLEEYDLLKPHADVVCESLKEDSFQECYGTLEQVKDATYGITRITYYKKR